jgi:hypothetical protein
MALGGVSLLVVSRTRGQARPYIVFLTTSLRYIMQPTYLDFGLSSTACAMFWRSPGLGSSIEPLVLHSGFRGSSALGRVWRRRIGLRLVMHDGTWVVDRGWDRGGGKRVWMKVRVYVV